MRKTIEFVGHKGKLGVITDCVCNNRKDLVSFVVMIDDTFSSHETGVRMRKEPWHYYDAFIVSRRRIFLDPPFFLPVLDKLIHVEYGIEFLGEHDCRQVIIDIGMEEGVDRVPLGLSFGLEDLIEIDCGVRKYVGQLVEDHETRIEYLHRQGKPRRLLVAIETIG